MANTEIGTAGIAHTVHVAFGDDDETDYDGVKEFENVLDVMDLPTGVKFSYQDGTEEFSGAQIVRSRVKGLDTAARYRCIKCSSKSSDFISATDRGGAVHITCPVCEEDSYHEKMDLDSNE